MQFIKYPNFEFKNLKKTWKISESAGYFQILTHENYEQTNGIQLEPFYTSPMLEISQQTEGLCRHKCHQRLWFWVQKLKENPKKCQNLEVFSNFNIL